MSEKYDELWDVEWMRIPNQNYIMKHKFLNGGYTVLVTNFSEIYGEKLSELNVNKRFFVTNPFVLMKTSVILDKIKNALESNLTSTDSEINVLCLSKSLQMELEFYINRVKFYFDLKPELLSAENLRAHVIAPTVLSSFLSFQENNSLNKKLEDSENKISSPQKSRIDPKASDVLSTLSQKSEIDVKDVLQTFVESQKHMLKYINDSKNHVGKTKTLKSTEVKKTEVLLPSKRELESEATCSSNIKYEDIANTSVKEEEVPAIFLGRYGIGRGLKEEDSSTSDSSLEMTQEVIQKFNKKKKTFNI